jgi:lipopolysaccharide transport protein LptA/LPS export ABC transporter protein LptC
MAITLDTRNARRPGRMSTATIASLSQRARAFAAAKRHSWVVAVLRVVCPLVAIGIVGAYALIAAWSWIKNVSPIKVDDVVIRADDLTMKNPSYFDVTEDGRYEVRAKRAVVPFNQNAPIKLIDVSGDLTQSNGTVTRLKAKHGLLENKKGELELFDGIEIDGTNGVMARLSRAMFYSKEGKVVSTDPVSATMPTGSVHAAAMTMNNKTKLVQFRGDVSVRLLPQQGQGFGQGLNQGLGTGRDARQPVKIRAEELDVDDAAKVAHFRGKVVAVQGETMLQAPYLMVKYEGKAADGLGSTAQPSADKDTGAQGTRVTFLWARNGVEVTAGTDRHITSNLADFDLAADKAKFEGKVVATQEKNVLKGERLLVDRKAGRTRLETPGNGRITATLQPNAPTQPRRAKRPTGAEEVQGAMLVSFKADRNAPMKIESDTLEVLDASNKAVFEGDVWARQGDLLLRTSELTAFSSGQTGMGIGNPVENAGSKAKGKEKGEIERLEARRKVILKSKDQQSATADWADFNVKDNTALLGGEVMVTRVTDDPLKPDVVKGDRLKVDLTTGISQFEAAQPALPQRPPPPPPPSPATSDAVAAPAPTPKEKVDACPPGRTCVLLQPKSLKEKAVDALKKKVPGINVP